MATTPPEHVAEAEPFSPSVFLDLPPTPHAHPDGDGDDDLQQASSDDMVLPFIRRMLMDEEENTDEYPDHPALLQAQQPFAQILSATVSTSTSTATHAAATDSASGSGSSATTNDSNGVPAFANTTWPYDPVELSQQLLWRTRSGGTGVVELDGFTGQQQALAFFHGSGGDMAIKSSSFGHGVTMDMLNLAFLKGMEEASRFLPTNNDLINSNQKRRLTQVADGETSRNSKLMAPEPEESGEMVSEAALGLLSSCLKDIASLRIAVGSSSSSNKTKKKKKQPPAHEEAGDLQTLLLHCAEAVGMNDRRNAADLLRQIRTHSSPTGDANQRLAHCFAEGLEARLAGTGSQVYKSLVSRRTSVVDYLKAYQLYVDTCCFKIMLFRFSNITIRNAAMGRKKVHIVDFGIGYGLQWPVLLRRLGTFVGGPPEVRITGIDLPEPGFRPSARIQQTGRRLSGYARQFGVPFKFRGIAAKWETVRVDDLDIEPDEVLIVNSLTPCGYLMNHRAGLRQLPLNPCTIKDIRERVQSLYHKDFIIDVDQQWLLQGWKGRILYAMSTWVANESR